MIFPFLAIITAKLLIQVGIAEGDLQSCSRKCGDGPKLCTYQMEISQETTMNLNCGRCPYVAKDCERNGCVPGGGLSRPVVLANQLLPGPSIIVCENDTIQVTVLNRLRSETTSIHWHGIHQVGTFFMDGLPFVSQYPIFPSGTFVYEFLASPQGTHMWHGHSGFQESDGLFGALVVKRKEPEFINSLYDFDLDEHIITIWHWYDKSTGDVLVPILHKNESVIGSGFLINGKGDLKKFKEGNTLFTTPMETFYVQQGFKYRFRLIFNSAIYCPVQFSIDEHVLKVISSETSHFQPVNVDSFMVGPGDRFDFVVDAQKEKDGCYVLRVRGLGDCGPPKAEVHQEAWLCYGNKSTFNTSLISTYKEADKNGLLLNPFEEATYDYSNKSLIHLTELNCTDPDIEDYSGTPDITYYIEIQSRIIENARFPGAWHQFNNVTFLLPGVSYLKNGFTSDNVCTDETRSKFCSEDYCSCIYKKVLPKNALVEIVLVDINMETQQDHPVHMHGYKFYLVAMEAIGTNISTDLVRRRNEKGEIKKNLHQAISKDTVSVPNRGYAILRFQTSNPGVWLFHCHVTNHMELGMGILLEIGEKKEILEMCTRKEECGFQQSFSSSITTSYLITFLATALIYITD